MKDEKELKPVSMRVRDAAESLLTVILEQVYYFIDSLFGHLTIFVCINTNKRCIESTNQFSLLNDKPRTCERANIA